MVYNGFGDKMNIYNIGYNSILCEKNGKILLENRAYDSVYIIKSNCRIKLAEKEYKVFPDCLILVNKGSAMEVTALDSPVFANYFCYREKVADIPEYTEDMRCNELSAIVKTMKSEEMKQQASYRDILGHYGQIFFLVAKRAIAEKETMQKIHPFYKLREDIYNQPYKKWNIEEIISASGLSRRQFYYSYKAVFNTSIKQDIIASRMDYAKYLLTNTDMRISQIAENCCYNSDQHFVQSFLKRYGVTPTDFRFVFLRFHVDRKQKQSENHKSP